MTAAGFRKSDFIAPQAGAGKKVIIAIDGPAASGKGTLARKLADRLGYAYLDTGMLYRAVGFCAMEMGADLAEPDAVLPAVAIVKKNLTPELLQNDALRTQKVADAASKVAALTEVRLELLDLQRDFAKDPGLGFGGAVLDGRDIGTVVCPDADVKIFVTASAEVRAQRRFAELQARGASATYDSVLQDLKERDARDTMRKVAPTIAADDAYVLDTSTLDAGRVLEETISIIRSKFIEQTDV